MLDKRGIFFLGGVFSQQKLGPYDSTHTMMGDLNKVFAVPIDDTNALPDVLQNIARLRVTGYLDAPSINWMKDRIVEGAILNFPRLMRRIDTRHNRAKPSRMTAVLDILLSSDRLPKDYTFAKIIEYKLLSYTPHSPEFAQRIINDKVHAFDLVTDKVF